MDFIERWFGISPDGGDGSLEILFIVLVGMIIVAIWMHLPTARKIRGDVSKKKKRY